MEAGMSPVEKPGYAWKVGAGIFSGLLFGIMLGVVSLFIRLVVGREAFENSAAHLAVWLLPTSLAVWFPDPRRPSGWCLGSIRW